jgi:hypothetical protein
MPGIMSEGSTASSVPTCEGPDRLQPLLLLQIVVREMP